jgi:hypothetical protein
MESLGSPEGISAGIPQVWRKSLPSTDENSSESETDFSPTAFFFSNCWALVKTEKDCPWETSNIHTDPAALHSCHRSGWCRGNQPGQVIEVLHPG